MTEVFQIEAVNGYAIFPRVRAPLVANVQHELFVTSPNLLPARSNKFRVITAAESRLILTAQPPRSVKDGEKFGGAIEVDVVDSHGNYVYQAERAITLFVRHVDPTMLTEPAKLVGVTTRAVASGRAVFDDLYLTGVVGDYYLSVESPPLLVASTRTISLLAGPAASIAVSMQPPTVVAVGDQWNFQVDVQV